MLVLGGGFAGIGAAQKLKKSDVIAAAVIRFEGSLVVTLGGGTARSTGSSPGAR